MDEILDIQRRAGILDEQGVTGVRGRGTDPLAQLDTETFVRIIDFTLEELGTLNPRTLRPQQKIMLARRVVARFKEPEQAQAGGENPQAQAQAQAASAKDPLA